MNTRVISLIYGVTFIAVGLLGFIPNPLVSSVGFFAVNAAHNAVHVLTGCVFIACLFKYPGYESRVLKIVGIGYVLVSVLGFLTSGTMLLGMVHINVADRWLHTGLAIAILGSGFMFKPKRQTLAAATQGVR